MRNILATLLAILICHFLFTYQFVQTQNQDVVISQADPKIEYNTDIKQSMDYQASTDSLSFWRQLPEKLNTIDENIKTKASKLFKNFIRSILSRRIN